MRLLTQLINNRPTSLVLFMGICVLVLSVTGTSVKNAASTVFALLVITSFFYTRDWLKGWNELSKAEKLFVIGFILYMVSGLLAFYNESDIGKYIKVFERYFRFFLIIPFYLLLVKKKISLLNYIYAGAIISGFFIFAVALNSYLRHPDLPASGHYHHIMFGELAMLNFGVMLALLLTHNLKRLSQLVILISMLCALIAAVLSQARGAWLVLPVYLIIATVYSIKEKKVSLNSIAAVLVVFVVISILSPVGGLIKKRIDSAITDVDQYYTNNIYDTSNGQRLAMWDIAFHVWMKHPVLGTGPGDFKNEIISLQNKGEYRKLALNNSVHNIFFQALVAAGIIGFMIFIFSLIVMPLRVIYDSKYIDRESRLLIMTVIIAESIFGLTESWTLRLPPVSVYLIYITVLLGHYHAMKMKSS